jgi:hypothetical protein
LAALIRAAGRRPAPSAEEYERVRLASHLAWQMKVHAARRKRVLWFALAAGMAAAVVGVLVTWQTAPAPAVAEVALLRGGVERLAPGTQRWEPVTAETALAAGTRLRTIGEGGAAFAVGDGISVRAADATSFVLETATRLTLHGGTLYVDTGGRAPRDAAIEIATPYGVVRDIGTQFEVRALLTEVRVRVREGSVQLRASGAPALAVPIELDGGSVFDALQWVARELGKRLVFEGNTELLARSVIMGGSSSADLEPLQILEVVTTSNGLDYTLGDGTLVIRRR